MKEKTKQKLANAQEYLAEITKVVQELPPEELIKLSKKIQKELEGHSPIPDGKYLTIDEVCQYLKMSRTTIWRYTKSGILKPKKIGYKTLYARADIDDYLKNGMSHE